MSENERVFGLTRTLRRVRWLALYVCLVAVSHAIVGGTGQTQCAVERSKPKPYQAFVELPAMNDVGVVDGQTTLVSYFDVPSDNEADINERAPIVLIHGSPGSASDFAKLWAVLSKRGYRVIAVDLPGFGESSRRVPSYSILAHARTVTALLEHLGIARAHVVGWSMGGGVVLHMADQTPRRVASMTMMAAIGSQRTEGSRSYRFEHMKYAAGYAVFVGVPEILPHFGLLPDPRSGIAYSWLRNFSDTNMRPLWEVMRRTSVPTLVLHGRRDFLVPDWAAEMHAECVPSASLVMLDASHFLPIMQVDETAGYLLEFIGTHNKEGAEVVPTRREIAAPRAHATGVVGSWTAVVLRSMPWWAVVGFLAILSLRWPTLATVLAAALAAQVRIDPAVGAMGAMGGRVLAAAMCIAFAHREGVLAKVLSVVPMVSKIDWERRLVNSQPGFWLGVRTMLRPDLRLVVPRAVRLLSLSVMDWSLFAAGLLGGAAIVTTIQYLPALLLFMICNSTLLLDYEVETVRAWMIRFGLFVGSFVVVYVISATLSLALTWTGRRMLLAKIRRMHYVEYWPTNMFYAPLAPYYLWLAYRTGRLVAYSACNPAIGGHGGMIGESKHEIQSRLDATTGLVLASVLIESSGTPRERAEAARRVVDTTPAIAGYPVIVKPDTGFRGFSVRVIRSGSEFEAYFEMMRDNAMLQRYHPGPHEVGVMWVRRLRSDVPTAPREQTVDAAARRSHVTGYIFSVTRKEFPYVVGDGQRTLEQLIYRDTRLRCQARVFLARFIDDASRVLAHGERLRLAQSGNHCQGTLFRDGADLVTPELERTIDRLASTYGVPTERDAACTWPEGGLDVGRFDLRFKSYEDLRAGQNFGVIELNGTTGESTNVYDPDKSIVWRYRVLYRLWRELFTLGAWRAAQGCDVMPARVLLASLRSFFRRRSGSELAD